MRNAILAAALLAGQCSTAGPAAIMKVTTDGGITGRGLGGVAVDASTAEASDNRRSCSGKLTDEEQQQLTRLLAASHPEAWHSSYGEPARPDQIRYTLDAGAHTTWWYGEAPSGLPIEIKRLYDALWSVRTRVLHDCP